MSSTAPNKSTAEQLAIYASIVYEPDAIVEPRLIHRDPERDVVSKWTLASQLPGRVEWLTKMNADGFNCYIGVNARLRYGAKGDDGVAVCHVLAADFDNGATVETVLAKIAAVGMPPPSLVVFTGHGVHCYWRLTEPMEPKIWSHWQKDLIALLGSDPKIFNPERVLRLPGFLNVKREPVPSYIVFHSDAAYDPCDLHDIIPEVPPVVTFHRVLPLAEQGDRVKRAAAYVAKMPPAVQGSHGSDATFHVAAVLNRFGLSRDEAMAVLSEYSQRCLPPWSEKELTHKIEHAFARNAGEHGDMLRRDRGAA